MRMIYLKLAADMLEADALTASRIEAARRYLRLALGDARRRGNRKVESIILRVFKHLKAADYLAGRLPPRYPLPCPLGAVQWSTMSYQRHDGRAALWVWVNWLKPDRAVKCYGPSRHFVTA